MSTASRPSAFDTAAENLLLALRKRGELRPGSLIVTIFGDAIAPRGGTVALASLISAGKLFAINERHIRTSVGRLAIDGWIEAQRRGRVSFYSLTQTGRRRFAEATQRIYGDSPARWDGQWTLVALLPGSSEERERVRSEMALLGFGQLQPGLFASPIRSAQEVSATLRELGVIDEVVITRATTVGDGGDQRIALTAWDIAELEKRYRDFVELFDPVARAAERGNRISDDQAFLVRTLLIHEYRRVHLRDPLLPVPLLPSDWSGRRADELCRNLYAAVFHPAERYLSLSMHSDSGRLPALRADTLRRFGGLRSA